MSVMRCSRCGAENLILNYFKDYKFKRRLKSNGKIVYFCCYNCMRKAERENKGKYCARRLKF